MSGSQVRRLKESHFKDCEALKFHKMSRLCVFCAKSYAFSQQSSTFRLSDRAARRILHTDLKFNPYKSIVFFRNCKDATGKIAWHVVTSFKIFLQMLFFSQVLKLIFVSRDASIRRIFRAGNNPRQLHKRCLHSERLTVWCVVAKFSLLNHSITVKSDRYVEMLLNFVEPINWDVQFQQDGVRPHTVR